MSVARAVVVLPNINGIAADAVQNTFCFADTAGAGQMSPANLLLAAGAVEAFYNLGSAGFSAPVSDWISSQISRDTGACKIRFYDLLDPEPRPLIAEFPFTLGPEVGGAQDLPDQVSLCLSFHGDLSGVAAANLRARRRGRVFIGPLHDNALPAQPAPPAPKPELMDSLRGAGAKLIDAGAVGAGYPKWSVWSDLDALPSVIVGGWVDNRFDTQRRRLPRPTTRSLWDASLVP